MVVWRVARTRNTVRYLFGRWGGRVEVMGWGRVGRVVVVVEGLGRVEEALVGRVVVGGERGWVDRVAAMAVEVEAVARAVVMVEVVVAGRVWVDAAAMVVAARAVAVMAAAAVLAAVVVLVATMAAAGRVGSYQHSTPDGCIQVRRYILCV